MTVAKVNSRWRKNWRIENGGAPYFCPPRKSNRYTAMKEYIYPEKNNADHVAEPVVEYETDTLIDEEDVAPFLRDTPMEELRAEIYRRHDAWLRGEVRGYTTEEVRKIASQWKSK